MNPTMTETYPTYGLDTTGIRTGGKIASKLLPRIVLLESNYSSKRGVWGGRAEGVQEGT
jgi:hypothetical protein